MINAWKFLSLEFFWRKDFLMKIYSPVWRDLYYAILPVMETESGFNVDAVSPAGAIGLMQLMPSTASDIGVNPYDPLDNVIGGVAHISTLLNSFSSSGDLVTNYAMAAYNAGSGAVMAAGGVPAYTETQNYIRRIYNIYVRLSSYEQGEY